jgi:hypothetical protein
MTPGASAGVGPAARSGSLEAALSRAGLWVLAATFFFMPLNGVRPVSSLSYGDVFLLIALVIAAALVLVRRQFPAVPWWVWAGSVLLLASALLAEAFPPSSIAELQASFPETPDETPLVMVAKLLVGAAVLPVVAGTVIRGWDGVGTLVSAWIAGVAISCATAVSDAYIGTDIQLALAYDIDSVIGFFVIDPARSIGLTVHSNTLSLTAVMVAPMVLSRMTGLRPILLYYPLFLLLFVAVLLSGARAGLVGIMLGTVLTLAFCPTVRKAVFSKDLRVWLVLIGGFLLMVALVFGVSLKPSSRAAEYFAPAASVEAEAGLLASAPVDALGTAVLVADAGDDGATPPTIGRFGAGNESAAESDGLRRQYLEDSLRLFAERPVPGYGFRWIESSHNIYLQLLLSGGVIALVGYLLFAFGYLRAGYRQWGEQADGAGDTARALTVSFALLLITGMVGNGIVDRYLYLPAALILAMSMVAPRAGGTVGAPPADGPAGSEQGAVEPGDA